MLKQEAIVLPKEPSKPDVYEVENRETKPMTLKHLHSLYNRGRLDTDEYQRNYVDRKTKWNTKLIESILCGIDIGSIEIVKVATENDGEKYYIVDGQHRVMTIMRYISNEYSLAKNHLTKVNPDKIAKKYNKLPEKWQNKIDESTVPVFLYKENEHHDAASIFLRRNEGAANLNLMERLNAVWCRDDAYKMLLDIAKESDWQKFALGNNDRFEALKVIIEFLKDTHYFDDESKDITKEKAENYFSENIFRKLSEKEIKSMKKKINDFLEVWRVVATDDKINRSRFWDCTEETGAKPHRILHSTLSIVLNKLTIMGKTDAIAHAAKIRDCINNTINTNSEVFFPVGDTRKSVLDSNYLRGTTALLLENIVEVMESEGVKYNIDKSVSKKLRETILDDRKQDNYWICEISGNKLISPKDIDIDHIIKRSLGGKTEVHNLRIVHKTLNRSQRYNFTDIGSEGTL